MDTPLRARMHAREKSLKNFASGSTRQIGPCGHARSAGPSARWGRTINRLQCSGAGIPKSSGVSGDTGDLYWQERAARQAMRDAATLLRVLFEANIKWISTRCGAGWSRARSFFKLAAAGDFMPPQPDQVRYPTYEFAILPGRRSFPGVWNRVEILQRSARQERTAQAWTKA